MSNNTLFRIAGIAGILSAVLMLAFSFFSDPATGTPPLKPEAAQAEMPSPAVKRERTK